MSVGDIARAIQNTGFFTGIRESGLLYPVLLSSHLATLAVFGGLILVTDLRLLGVAFTNIPVSRIVRGTRPWKHLGLLMMITRRNAVTQVVGFMSLENGLVLAATGAKGMPLVVEISVAFSILIAFIVFGIFVFRIRERFDTVDVSALDRFRGEQRDVS